MGFLKVLLLAVVGVVLNSCSSSLAYVDRESTLDKVEALDKESKKDGSHDKREFNLAVKEIENRQISADPKKGLDIDVFNCTPYVRRFILRRRSGWGENPVMARFTMVPWTLVHSQAMPGWYTVECWNGNNLVWTKDYQVTSAPELNGFTGEYTHCAIGSIDDGYYAGWRYDGKLTVVK